MAAKKSAQYPYRWPDGSWHSRPPTPKFSGYSPDQINQLNGVLPGGTGVQGVAGVTDTPGDGDLSQPPPAVMPQPFDPAFEASRQGAQWNVQVGDAEAAYQTGQTAHQTGYNADGSLNTSNPYSQAQLLQDNWHRSVTGADNSMAAAGQLYSGARLNAQARNDRLYAQNSSALRDQAGAAYHGIGVSQLQTYGANSLGVGADQFSSLKRSIYGS